MSRTIAFVGCCYAVALWTASSFFGLSDDVLFFHSDPLSKAYFLAALAFLLLPAALAIVGAAAGVFRRYGALRIAGAFPLSLVLAGLLIFGGEWAFGKIQTFTTYLASLGAAIAVAATLIWFLPNRATVLDRAVQLSRLVLLVALPFTAACWVYFHLDARAAGANAPRHVVMVLVDGMPSQLLSSYAPETPQTELDRVARRGCVIDHAYTSRTYTSGYFSVFYTGERSGNARAATTTLPHVLEQAGAGFRWIAFHSNGFPETSHVTGYAGLRSAQLSERWAWLPRLLGLHYHVFLTWDETRRYMGSRVDAIYRALNGRTDEEGFWRDVLPRQIEEMQARYGRSFLLVHVSMTKHTVQAMADGSFGDRAADFGSLMSHATANDYTYTPEQAPVVDAYRNYYRTRMDEYGRHLGRLLDTLARTGRSDDTLVVLTADHGSAFTGGRLWYGPHSGEETARVPLLFFGNRGTQCPSPPVADTLDLRATIDAFLGLPSASGAGGRDLLASGPSSGSARVVPVLTVRDDKRKTWFLELHAPLDVRYVFNLHPEGDGRALKGTVRGYEVDDMPLDGEEQVAWRAFAAALDSYAIAPTAIHADLRTRLGQHVAGQPR
jgi:hypothetical protein